jgi:hypothetical protein
MADTSGPTSYDVTVSAGGKKPVLAYKGPVPKVANLEVRRAGGMVSLVYDEAGGTQGVLLDQATDPGGALTLTRHGLDEKLKHKGEPVTKQIDG